jgi:hypothetical protein
MMDLAQLLAPLSLAEFEAVRHQPVHIPAGGEGPKRAILDWAGFNALLSQTSSWTADTLKLVKNGEPVPPARFCSVVNTLNGPSFRPSPARVEVLLSEGASLIANDVQRLTPAISALCDALGQAFAASAQANIYCSFGGVQAFGTHYDLHDVFAVHLEGEKVWRLYANRAADPVDAPEDPDPRAFYAANRGPLMREVVMRPGDVLYLPRGWYHDALASDAASLHLTLSVTPLYGRILFSLLEQAALQDPAFRAWFPPASADGGRHLQDHLDHLAGRLASIMRSEFFRNEIAMAQTRLVPRPTRYSLPGRKPVTVYRPTGRTGPALTGPVTVAMGWALSQARFSLEDLAAQFDFVPETAIHEAVAAFERAGALERV